MSGKILTLDEKVEHVLMRMRAAYERNEAIMLTCDEVEYLFEFILLKWKPRNE